MVPVPGEKKRKKMVALLLMLFCVTIWSESRHRERGKGEERGRLEMCHRQALHLSRAVRFQLGNDFVGFSLLFFSSISFEACLPGSSLAVDVLV